ncbi:MAG: hypothetical protein U1C53_01965, partial [Candidatus Veblenbacteria bacterium]|nr:hypothetical protein [Candidatus Veblenbacteria bacterium]
WYNVPFIRMSWPVRPGASYSYVLSRSPNEEPDEVPDEPTGEIKLSISEDGVFYFHLRECRAGTCGPTVTRRAMKDTTPPERLELAVGAASGVLEGKVFLSFTASDATSGVAHYEVWEEAVGETWERVMSPYVLQDQAHQGVVRVRAYDTAGNYREEILSPLAPEPWYRSEVVFWGILVVGLAALGVTIFVKRRGQAGPAPQANQSSTPPLP